MQLSQLSGCKRLIGPWARHFANTTFRYAGHNKWSKIKEGKGANDAFKSKVYGKANQEIILAARRGGSTDPGVNSVLAATIARAKAAGVPKANIASALEQARKNKDTGSLQEYTYGALLGRTVALSIECFSDNGTRTLRNIREIVKSYGAQLANVSYLFKKEGQIVINLLEGQSLIELEDEALEGGAEDVENLSHPDNDRKIKVIVPEECFFTLEKSLKETGYSIESSELLDLSTNLETVELDEETRNVTVSLIKVLKEHPDVHNVRISAELE